MPGTFEYGEKAYTLTDLIVSRYNITANTYGTPQALASGQMMTVEPEHDTDQLRGYGVKTALLSVSVGAKLTLGNGGIDFSALNIMADTDDTSSGSAPNRVRKVNFKAGGAGLPYFGAIGVAPTDDGGICVVGLQACKLDVYPTVTFDGKANKFNLSEVAGYAIPITISSQLVLHRAKVYETAADWVAPATGTAFLQYFTT